MFNMRYARFFSLLVSFALLVAPLPLAAMAQDSNLSLSEWETSIDSEGITRAAKLRTLVVDENMDVLGSSVFHKHMKTKEGIHILGKLKVSKSAKFKKNVTIDGTLSIADVVIASCLDSLCVNSLSVTDLAVENCMNNLCINNVSVVDESISGTLSANNAIITNALIGNLTVTATVLDSIINNLTVNIALSANDAVINNATVTNLSATTAIVQDLTVNNCINSLCVNQLSVVNATINGTLSVNNEIVSGSLNFLDPGPGYVGIKAPTTVPTSYTVSLPATVPTANQYLQAGSVIPTDLTWFTSGGSISPAVSETIYVAQYGNDITGNGSFDTPYATLAQAINVVNGLANVDFPVCIFMFPGTYIENNSTGPLIITASGVSIVGASPEAVYIMSDTPSNNFIVANGTIYISHVAIESFAPLATGLSLTAGNLSIFDNVRVANFATGVVCSGGPNQLYGFSSCVFVQNGTALSVNNSRVECLECSYFGTASLTSPAANTAVSITGAGANLVLSGGAVGKCTTGFDVAGNSTITISGTAFKFNTFDVVQTGASHMVLTGSSFELTNGGSDIDIQVSGAGTFAEIVGCQFNGNNDLGVAEGQSIVVSDNAYLNISSGSMKNYTMAIQVGVSTDTASTIASISGFTISNCSTDIQQEGSTTLNFNAGTSSRNKIIVNDPTNVKLAYFDLSNSNQLTIGSTSDIDTGLIAVNIDSIDPSIDYLSSLYSTQAIGMNNPTMSPSTLYVVSTNNANLTAITTDNTDTAGLRLVSDTGSPVGGTSALRGWDIDKNGANAQLSFAYQNSDIVGQITIPEYTVMQLDGFNNQLQLPAVGTQIVFDEDTNLYRSAANVLKTDDNFIVGTLTPGTAVITDPTTNQLASSVTTSTELSYVHGVTSSIQTQLNSKVNKSGDIMTGTLTLPAGSISAPSLQFTGSSTGSGISAPTANTLSFDIAGVEQMNLSASGVTIDGFTTAGVVHNNATGLLSTSLIVDADIAASTITNDRLATISNFDIAGDIVVRDGTGNFATNMITLDGTPTLPTDAVTKAYVDAAIELGISAKIPCIVVSTTDIGSPPAGLQTIDGVTLVADDRVLLVGQTNEIFNGIWLAQTGAWTYPSDWPLGTEAGAAYVLILSGATNAGSSWLCNSPTAIIGTDPITFTEFALPSTIVGANIGTGTGLVFADKTGVTLNFRSLLADQHMTITTNTSTVEFSIDATNLNTPSTIVARDGSGNFVANTITANLTGAASLNVLKAGDTMTGILTMPAGTILAPSIEFTGSNTGTGISAPTTNQLSFDISGTEQMNISSSGVNIDGILSVDNEVINGTLQMSSLSTGILHSDSSGNITSSLIVDADITAATITNDKLANISSTNIANDIVVRDAFGNFTASTIMANLIGAASLNVLKAGDTMTGTLQLPAGTTALPSLTFTGSTTAGLSASTGNLSFSTNGMEQMKISSGGIISIDGFTVAGVVHNDASGNLSSSLIVDADVAANANISDTKLATITTPGTVANSATTATSADVANSIVLRDPLGNFSANAVSFNDAVIGNLTLNNMASFNDAIITNGTVTNLSSTDAYIQYLSAIDETITGTSSINDAIITSGTITNLSSTDAYINFLSVVDETITGTSSIADAIITNAVITNGTATNLSSTDAHINFLSVNNETITGTSSIADAIIVNGTVTNLSSTDAYIQFLSVIDETITGTASITDAIITNATIGTLSVSSEILSNITITNLTTADAIITSGTVANLSSTDAYIQFLSVIDETITGTSSIADAIIVNGTVTNLSSTDAYIQFLSVIDETITGTVSITDAIITNATIGSLSIASAIVPNITITNLTTTDAIITSGTVTNLSSTDAYIQFLSVVDETITGTSSIVDAIITNSTVATLSVSNEIISGNLTLSTNPSTATAGAIMKGSNSFIHNTGVQNTFMGVSAGNFTLTGSGGNGANAAFGATALGALTSGIDNTAVGFGALSANTVAGYNTAVGFNALKSNTAAQFNTAIGYEALLTNTTGTQNTAIGSQALLLNTTGSNNTAIGFNTLSAVTTGGNNIAIGVNAGGTLTTGSGNIYFAANAATATETNTTRIGTTQTLCVISGTITTSANLNLTTEPSTSAAGIIQKNGTSFIHDVGTNNTFVGISAGSLTTSGSGGNTGIGAKALTVNGTGAFNTAVGYQALTANITGVDNTAFGYDALLANTTGTDNTALGYNTLSAVTTGDTNIAIGSGAGGTLTTGSGNIYINANAATATEATTTRIGTSQTVCAIAGIFGGTYNAGSGLEVFVDNTGTLGTTASSRRFKHDIEDINAESATIYQLRPVSFAYNHDISETKQYGLIAEEVNEVIPTMVVHDEDGQPYTVQYHMLPVLLLNEIKKQQVTIEQRQSTIDALTLTTDNMSAAISSLQEQIKQFVERIKMLENKDLYV